MATKPIKEDRGSAFLRAILGMKPKPKPKPKPKK
jgi:hypothetical protein